MTCEEAKAARFSPKECLQAGFTWQEGKAAGFASGSGWNDRDKQRYWEMSLAFGYHDWDGRVL